MKSIFRLSDDLIVNFDQVKCIRSYADCGVITWIDNTETRITEEEADLAISRHREIYEPRHAQD